MDPWHLEETRRHVATIYGRRQLDLARPCIRSVVDREDYARIHYQDAQLILDEYVDASLKDASLMSVTLGGDDEAWSDFNVFIRKIGAHLVACVQSLHSLPDILGHAIYYSLGMNLSRNALSARQITPTSVLKKLQRENDAKTLCELFAEVFSGGSFSHLSALANHSKHRSLVFPALNEDLTGSGRDRHSIVFEGFAYEGVWYPQIGAKEFLAAEYRRISVLVVQCGNELNSVLRSRAQ